MSEDVNVEWKVDNDRTTRDDAKKIVDQITTQVEDQTDEEVVIREGEQLEPGSGAVLITFLIGVSSALTAQAISKALTDLEETEDVSVNVDVDADEEADVDIEISVDE